MGRRIAAGEQRPRPGCRSYVSGVGERSHRTPDGKPQRTQGRSNRICGPFERRTEQLAARIASRERNPASVVCYPSRFGLVSSSTLRVKKQVLTPTEAGKRPKSYQPRHLERHGKVTRPESPDLKFLSLDEGASEELCPKTTGIYHECDNSTENLG